MRKIDDMFPDLGFLRALMVVIVLGFVFQLSGVWMTMIIVGVFGAFFTRRHRHSFLVGLLGVGIAWTVFFVYLTMTAQALAVAEFFISLLGISGGILVIVISVLLGSLLGGFGGLFGRSLVELIDEFIPPDIDHETPAYPEPEEETPEPEEE